MLWAVSLLTMELIPHSLTSKLYIISILSLQRFGTELPARIRNSALPLSYNIYRCAKTHFGENQLAPSSIGISPLTTIHPLIFQHQSVRSSTSYYRSFNLTMVRSLGFGSINSDKTLYSSSLSLWLQHSLS